MNASPATPAAAPKSGDRVGVWICKLHADSGRLYFKNTETSKTQWTLRGTPWEAAAPPAGPSPAASPAKERPVAAAASPASAPGTDAVGDPTAPITRDGWIRKFDKKSERFFFKEIATGKTQWKSAGTPFEGDASSTRGSSSAVASPASTAEAAAHAPVTIDGWRRSWDARKNKYYYTNLATRKPTYDVKGTPFENFADN